MPDPFGMRWFGIIAAYCAIWAAVSVLTPHWVSVVCAAGFISLALGVITVSTVSSTCDQWLRGRWL